MRKLHLLSILVTALLSGCTQKAPAPAPALQPVASIQELMQSLVDPSADALWESVSSTVTASGTEDKQPRSDAEWTEVRHLAIRLVEAANLLAIERPVAHEGRTLEDAHVAGILQAAEIRQKIDADRPAFVARAQSLQLAAQAALVAIDARSVERLLEAGAQLDQACEQCHQTYWYPNDKRPKELGGPEAAAQR